MQESPRESRRRIWNVRSSFLQNNSHNTGLYATSAQELISNDPDSVPFYDSALRDLYENLWLPTRIDSPESLSTSSNFSLRNAEVQSWFWAEEREIPQRTNWVRIYSPSFTFSPAGTTAEENIPVNPLYFSKERPVVQRGDQLIMVDDDRFPLIDNEVPAMRNVRFRTLGCYPLTAAVESDAKTVEDVVEEVLNVKLSERATRLIDGDKEDSMEKKKTEGYF
jgi:hypothetical protein